MSDLSGTVRAVANGFAAVETRRGHVLLELMGQEPEGGDEVTGIQFMHGGQRVEVHGRELSVFVQQLDATWESARRGMGLSG